MLAPLNCCIQRWRPLVPHCIYICILNEQETDNIIVPLEGCTVQGGCPSIIFYFHFRASYRDKIIDQINVALKGSHV